MKFTYTLAFIISFSVFLPTGQAGTKVQEVAKDTPESTITTAEIYLGKTLDIAECKLRFEAVVEDSRCPKGTDCIWAGQVKVKIGVLEDSGNWVTKEVTIKSGVKKQKIVTTSDGTEIFLAAVKPYPDANVPNADRKYYIVLNVAEEAKTKG